MRALAVLLSLLAAPLAAQEPAQEPAQESERACLESAAPGQGLPGCAFDGAQACYATATGDAVLDCLTAATARWDGLLNEEYAGARETFAGEIGDAIQTSQRAWIAFRDAECALTRLRFSHVDTDFAVGNCLLDLTASRTAALRDMYR